MLHNVSLHYGDRPQLGRLLQDHSGAVLAAFFSVTSKNEGNKPIAGLVIVSVSQTGPARAAVLTDDANRFPTTLNSLFQRLKTEVNAGAGVSPGAQEVQPAAEPSGAASAPAAPLRQAAFPDGSGVIGLPAGWSVINAQKGDVAARGPRGEKLRFGIAISVLDPRNPQSRALMRPGAPAPGAFLAIPYGTDPAVTYKMANAQIAEKMRKEPPAINVTAVKELPITGGGKSYLLGGDIDAHDGQGPMQMVVQMIISQPMALGGYQMTVFQVMIPQALAQEEKATVAAIFHSYQANGRVIQSEINSEMAQTKRMTDDFTANVRQRMDSSDRQTQAFCNLLLDQSVVRDTQYNAHGTFSDGLSDALVQSNPNRFEYVPPSQYVKGIDY